MYLMIDNYDSFVYNLVAYLKQLGEEIKVIRNDEVTLEQINKMENLKGIIISPGPKSPKESGLCLEIVKTFGGKVPILGVCLGHQIIGYCFGAQVKKGLSPVHGKVTPIEHKGEALFMGLPPTYQVTRYHSLVVEKESLPEQLRIDAQTKDGIIMAISHRKLPIYGVQFHPEAILTEYGHELLKNFMNLCEMWWTTSEDNNQRMEA